MSLKELEDSLFDEWEFKSKEKGRVGFNRDGLPNEKEYLKTTPKILLILRESYGESGDFDMRPYLLKGSEAKSVTWRNAPKWIAGIVSLYNDKEKTLEEVKAERWEMGWQAFNQNYIPKISMLNLNKQHSKLPIYSDYQFIETGVEDRTFINRQIEIYDPDIIITAGTFNPFYDKMYNHSDRSIHYQNRMTTENWYAEGFKDKKGRMVMNTFHPGALKKDQIWYDSIMDIVKQFKEDK